MRFNGGTGGRRERARIVHDAPARQRAQRRVQVIKTGVSQRQRQAALTKLPLEEDCRRCVRAETAPKPEQAPPRVPDAVARTFQDDAVRKCRNLIEQATRSERSKGGREDRLLVAPFGMAKAR